MSTAFVQTPWTYPSGVWSQLISGPTEEPLTLADAKLRAGLDWLDGDPRDAMMEDFIRAARAQVEHDTGLALLTQVHEVTFAASAPGELVPLPSQTQPAQSIEYLEPAPSQTISLPWMYRAGVGQMFITGSTGATVRITSGWPDAATFRQEAPSLFHAVALLTAHYATLGRDLVTADGDGANVMPLGYEEAIGPHRLVWVT